MICIAFNIEISIVIRLWNITITMKTRYTLKILARWIDERLRPDFTSNLVHGLAVGTPKVDIAPYDKINHGFLNLNSNCDVKSGHSFTFL